MHTICQISQSIDPDELISGRGATRKPPKYGE